MPHEKPDIPPELWVRAEALFDRLVEASDPEALLRAEPDEQLAALVRRLWESDRQAGGQGFMENTLTLVREWSAPAEPCFQPGQLLAGRFTVECLLGAGGMGEVYLAHDPKLKERVALKTIRRDLAADPVIGRRFLAEVQNARRVTHSHVCRINELLEEGATPFFTMQYLEGVRLNDWLLAPHKEATRRRIALELAEGLAAAHRARIVHCDFKPANVILTGDSLEPSAMITDFGLARAFAPEAGAADESATAASHSLRAGTRGYMAPELLAGGRATVRSDIYAYGKVLGELLPGLRLAAQCAAEQPEDRPATLEPVVRALGGGWSRRLWMVAGAAAAAGAATGSYALLSRRPIVLSSRQRVAVNGFRPDGAHSAFVVRDLLLTALRQSPLLMVMADDRLRALLRMLEFKPQLPADPAGLLAVAAHEGALVIEGALLQLSGGGLRLALQVFPQGESTPALRISEQVDDSRQMVRLADQTALRLRRELGESAGSLAASVPLAQVTSAVPEAVDLYFQGIAEYEQSRSAPALTLFDEALRLDPRFAMAHQRRGLTLASSDRLFQAIPAYERAFELRSPLTDHERLWIESRYYHIVGDDVASLQSCRKLIALYPEEATFQRGTAIAMTRRGRPRDALAYNRRAVELDPSSLNNMTESMVNHVEAGLFEDAVALFNQWKGEAGNRRPWLTYRVFLAYLGLEDYGRARQAVADTAQAPELEREARLLQSTLLIATGQLAQASSALASDLAWDVAQGQERMLQIRRVWLGWLAWLMDDVPAARRQIAALGQLEPSPAWLQPLRECGMLAAAVNEPAWVAVVLERLREIERRWPSTQSKGARAHMESLQSGDRDRARTTALMGEAQGLWADPLTLYSLAQWQQRQADFPAALATLEDIEARRGTIYRLFFPGLVTLSRIERARCLAKLSRFDESVRLYGQVLDAWGASTGRYSATRGVENEYRQLKLKLKLK